MNYVAEWTPVVIIALVSIVARFVASWAISHNWISPNLFFMALETYAAFIDCKVFEAAAPSSPILCRGVDRALQTNTDNSNSKKARSVTFRRGIFCLPVERNCGGCDSGTLLVFAFTCSTRASKCEPASSAKPGSVLRRFPQKSCCVTASPPPFSTKRLDLRSANSTLYRATTSWYFRGRAKWLQVAVVLFWEVEWL